MCSRIPKVLLELEYCENLKRGVNDPKIDVWGAECQTLFKRHTLFTIFHD